VYCRAQLGELSEYNEQLKAVDAQVMAISTDDLSKAMLIVERLDLPFPILYDPSADVVSQYGVYNLLRDGLATPSTFIIDKNGVIRWKYVANEYTERPSAEDVMEQLRVIEG